ncbi:MAG: acetylornithine deacetylase/succinyl-diaminopimelate desuccinylase family protein [Shimia sp.]
MTEPDLHRAVEARRDDLIALTQALVRIPSLNPPGAAYRTACELVRDRLAPQGFACETIRAEGAPGDTDAHPRWNLVARREGTRPGECVHFTSHVDVVEVGSGWTHDPFGGALVDGRIYGRGSCDMKGGLATSIVAAEAFLATHPSFDGAIEISATADEESGGYAGVAFLAERGVFDPARVQHVIIPEPLHKDGVCLGHRGGWWAEIETFGRIAHGCMPFLGDCAIRHMAALLDRFETELFPALAARRTEMPVIPEAARASTMNVNAIHGGQAEQTGTGLPTHVVPESCRIVIDRRYLAEERYEDVRGEVTAILEDLARMRPGFAYALRELNHVPPSMTAPDAPIAATVAREIEAVLGRPARFVASPGTYDQKHVDRIGGLKNCIAYGPGVLEMAHQPDEWVGVEDMIDSAKVMARTLAAILLPSEEERP